MSSPTPSLPVTPELQSELIEQVLLKCKVTPKEYIAEEEEE